MDANRILSADALPARLGLTEDQMHAARAVIDEALGESVTMGALLGTLKAVLRGLDDPEIGPVEAVTRELDEWEALMRMSIAYRAFALGLNAGRQAAGNEEDQA